VAKTASNVAINKVRTGNGDLGFTKLGGKTYSKGHAIVALSAALDSAQALTAEMPDVGVTDGVSPRTLIQEVLFRAGAAIGGRSPRAQQLPLAELGLAMETNLSAVTAQLRPLDSFLRTTPENAGLQALRAAVREAEVRAAAARDQVEVESKDTSPGLLEALGYILKALNIASDLVFGYVWLVSTTDKGNVAQNAKWLPMTEDQIRSLNDGQTLPVES
jgi:cob(I)alamin adenosyltransferase